MRLRNRVTVWIVLGLAVAVGAALWLRKEPKPISIEVDIPEEDECCPDDDACTMNALQAHTHTTGDVPQVAGTVPITGTRTNSVGAPATSPADEAEAAAEAEARKVIAPLQEDLDSGDLKVVAAAAQKLMGHANAKVRLQAVESLAWAESDGFADLSKMLLDNDADVAQAALEAWALQVQGFESTQTKAKLLAEVGPVAMGLGSDAFQNVLDAMFDMPDADALKLLQGYSAQTESPELIEKIIDAVNNRAMPDTPIESLADIPKTIEAFLKNAALEAAEEAAGENK
ncbi:MAG: hypothetical protein FJ222_05310 [Lentisphaerae bacterium]|nr:hypothetical protein [Lentisphaerota bacterium]